MPLEIIHIFIIVLIFIALYIGFIIGRNIQKLKSNIDHKQKIPEIRKEAISKSRAVLSGQFSEQLAPYLPDFEYKPTEVRFIGKPIDFLVFRGLDEKKVKEVVFVEVKSGESKLSSVEKSLKETIENKKIKWEEYRVPK
tara:strand:- start:262 stop:678 length:417 start_codon:yes stop_codon:yes gene_type:complete